MVADSNVNTTTQRLPRPSGFHLFRVVGRHVRDSVRHFGWRKTILQLFAGLVRALRESLPDRRRARFGDLDFDFDHSVDTTRSNTRPISQFIATMTGSPYFATEPWLFAEMMQALPIDFAQFTFIDLGSGKGRVLLMASKYPFQKIIGVEFMPDLNRCAQENIAGLPQTVSMEMDVRDFQFPSSPVVVYLFNPFPEPVLAIVLAHLECSWRESQRPIYVAYRSPEFEYLLADSGWLKKMTGKQQWAIYKDNDSTQPT